MTYKCGLLNLFFRSEASFEEVRGAWQTSGYTSNQLLRKPEIATLGYAIRAVVSALMAQRCNKLQQRLGFDDVTSVDTHTHTQKQSVFALESN